MDSKVTVGLIATALAVIAGGIIYNSSLNLEFDIILPTHPLFHVILSSGNYTNLQHNVGAITVINVQNTQAKPTMGYCPLAKLIHENQGDYNSRHVGNGTIFTATIPPQWCDKELKPIIVPEFAISTPFLILIIAMLGIITVSYIVSKKFIK